ncbi:MAG TPA: hypothetical protein VH208_12260 [Myxococcaceae bacterium]|nr:hypothetical protein [Myxococcaceae bacterium]
MTRSIAWCVLAISASAVAEGKGEKKDAAAAAGVNWDGQVLKATGSGAPDMKASSPAQARLGAERAAQLDALRNLLAQVKGIQVSGGKTVGDQMAAKDELKGKVEGAVKGFKVVKKRYFADNGVEIDVEVPLAALTEVVDDGGDSKTAAIHSEGAEKNTGLVVDARGLDVKPALAPRLLDESGKALYGIDCLSADAKKSSGVASYVKSLEEAKKNMRVGDRPLVLKAAKAQGTDLVLSADDVKKLAESNNSYLAQGRVVIVTN